MSTLKKIILPLICAVAAILLALVNMVTQPKIEEYELSIAKEALTEVSLGNDFGDEILISDRDNLVFYHEMSKNNGKNGYIVGLKSSGYGGELTLVASYDLDGNLLKAKLLTNSETPGVGKKAENPDYMNMFIGKNSDNLPLKKDMLSSDDVAVVSGATLTFGGISKALSAGSEFVKEL